MKRWAEKYAFRGDPLVNGTFVFKCRRISFHVETAERRYEICAGGSSIKLRRTLTFHMLKIRVKKCSEGDRVN